MELRIGARRTGGIWHGYVEGRHVPDDELRALTAGIALEKAERAARKIAEKGGFLGILKLVRIPPQGNA
jgi:hypothetical protein